MLVWLWGAGVDTGMEELSSNCNFLLYDLGQEI